MSEPPLIDAVGLKCPLPVLRLRKRLAALPPGTVVRLEASDRAALIDVPHFCAEGGHALVAQDERDGVLTFDIRKG